jgi:hypothetical protein
VPFVSAVIAQRKIIRRFPTTSAGGWCSVCRLTQAPGTKTTNLNYFLMLSGLTERFALSEGLSRRYRFRPKRALKDTITAPGISMPPHPGQSAQATASVAVTTWSLRFLAATQRIILKSSALNFTISRALDRSQISGLGDVKEAILEARRLSLDVRFAAPPPMPDFHYAGASGRQRMKASLLNFGQPRIRTD